ncbi:MAG: hypothetical protein IKO07_07280 [Clostridia bacterium]|nr:hypothetical protein [Clostridia bacterium]
MRLGQIGGATVRLNPLALPMMGLAIWLGSGQALVILSVSALLHELGHALAARLLRVRVIELELMPVGGAARLDNVWKLRPGQLIGVALAGPVVNLAIALVCRALPPGPWDWAAAQAARQNAALMLFNLLPALPLDGGRILSGLLARRMPPAAAARVGVRLGFATAGALLLLAARSLARGRLNLSPLIAALFMILSAQSELQSAGSAALASLMERREELRREQVLPARLFAVTPETELNSLLPVLRPRQAHLFLCLDGEGQRFVSEEAVWRALLEGGKETVGDVARFGQ